MISWTALPETVTVMLTLSGCGENPTVKLMPPPPLLRKDQEQPSTPPPHSPVSRITPSTISKDNRYFP